MPFNAARCVRNARGSDKAYGEGNLAESSAVTVRAYTVKTTNSDSGMMATRVIFPSSTMSAADATLFVDTAKDTIRQSFPSTEYPAPVVGSIVNILSEPNGKRIPSNFKLCKKTPLADAVYSNLDLGGGQTSHEVSTPDFFFAVVGALSTDIDDRLCSNFFDATLKGVLEALKQLSSTLMIVNPAFWLDIATTPGKVDVARHAGSIALAAFVGPVVTNVLASELVQNTVEVRNLVIAALQTPAVLRLLFSKFKHRCLQPGGCPLFLDSRGEDELATGLKIYVGAVILFSKHGRRAFRPWMEFVFSSLAEAAMNVIHAVHNKIKGTAGVKRSALDNRAGPSIGHRDFRLNPPIKISGADSRCADGPHEYGRHQGQEMLVERRIWVHDEVPGYDILRGEQTFARHIDAPATHPRSGRDSEAEGPVGSVSVKPTPAPNPDDKEKHRLDRF
ncbi:hypothetical protein DFH09DRAFT_1085646 [Mycena vulgaris]|nr:hypothetical protein DFH09DRAFT_1085646 [Mycena vulgaris]